MAHQNDQGTGRHGHKDTHEPYPHHASGDGGSRSGSDSRQASGSEQESLKEREYRDKDGNVHHHTETYEEQHGKK